MIPRRERLLLLLILGLILAKGERNGLFPGKPWARWLAVPSVLCSAALPTGGCCELWMSRGEEQDGPSINHTLTGSWLFDLLGISPSAAIPSLPCIMPMHTNASVFFPQVRTVSLHGLQHPAPAPCQQSPDGNNEADQGGTGAPSSSSLLAVSLLIALWL